MYSFPLDAIAVMPTRVEAPPPDSGAGGWELVADVYTLLVDFNQTGFTLHQVSEPEDAEDDSADGRAAPTGGSQPCGSQGAPPEPSQQTAPVDVAYADIRSIKRGASCVASLSCSLSFSAHCSHAC